MTVFEQLQAYAEKENSPEILAYLQTFGESNIADADFLNFLKGAILELHANGCVMLSTDTYSDMVNLNAPATNTIVRVLNDENKGITNSTYLWYADGKRFWIATAADN